MECRAGRRHVTDASGRRVLRDAPAPPSLASRSLRSSSWRRMAWRRSQASRLLCCPQQRLPTDLSRLNPSCLMSIPSVPQPLLDSLLATKLYIPALRPHRVPRPRLTARLEAGTGGPLTLLSAPAGFGKSTLLSEWIHQGGR